MGNANNPCFVIQQKSISLTSLCVTDDITATKLFQEAPFPVQSAGKLHRCMMMHEFKSL